MALAFDEFGRPFIIIREQEQKTRLRGIDAQKANISAGRAIARILKTSLGPKGMDKMLQSPDGDVTISQSLFSFQLFTLFCMRFQCFWLLVQWILITFFQFVDLVVFEAYGLLVCGF